MKEAPRSPSPSRSRSVFSRLGSEARRRKERPTRSPSQASSRSGSVFTRLGAKSHEQRRRDTRERIKSYVTCSSERQRENQREYRHREREASSGRKNNKPLEGEDSVGGRLCSKENHGINDVYEQEFEQRIIARMEERLDQFVDLKRLVDMIEPDVMNSRRHGDRNGRRSEGEESENSFFEGDGSSSDE
ncbi:hypothetical protein Tco_1360491 [Tanacetum coccineum]